MPDRSRPSRIAGIALCVCAWSGVAGAAWAQTVEDGSDARIGKADARTVLDLIRRHLDSPDARVTALRRSGGAVICGSVDVKNREGLYLGERGFVVDLADLSFGRVPDGPELMNPRAAGFAEMERIRARYFAQCLD